MSRAGIHPGDRGFRSGASGRRPPPHPSIRPVHPIRRRFHLIPFTVTIPAEERDPTLTERLKAEWRGILAWMIEGCTDWREHGLAPPTAVTAATAVYLQAQDAITAWIDECCEQDPGAWAPSATLFNSWTAWTHTSGEYAGSRTRFLDALESRGFEPFRKAKARGVQGLSIRVSDAKDGDWVVRE